MSININNVSFHLDEFTILVPVVSNQVKPFHNAFITDHAPLSLPVSNALTDLAMT